ncbi:MAG: hypothetical protein J1D87_01180 [Lachnospiraceae bacterium]|nr:hypothetical protein [Lachnospiraceae bacterium]
MKKELDYFRIGKSYGGCHWLNFNELWDTGYSRKGGMIIYKTVEGR